MKIVWISSLSTVLLVIMIWGYKHTTHATPSANPPQISLGLRELVCEDSSRAFQETARRLEVAIWYPTHQTGPRESLTAGFWKTQPVVRNAPIADGTFPLILFSHGYGGSQWSNSWLAEQLVPHGYIVASVRHYGNSAGNIIPELCVRAWNRPHDISVVLDYLLQDPELSQYIDKQNIGAAGFSQGGLTALWLGGIQADLTPANLHQQITALSDPEWRNEHFADLPAERLDTILDQFTTADFEAANRSYQDSRIKAVFAMAPALDAQNIMFTPQGLAQSHIPVSIVVGQADSECVPQAQYFAQYIDDSSLTIIAGNVSHLTFLNEGKEPGNTVYTTDHPSVNRNQVHAEIAVLARTFFDQRLKER